MSKNVTFQSGGRPLQYRLSGMSLRTLCIEDRVTCRIKYQLCKLQCAPRRTQQNCTAQDIVYHVEIAQQLRIKESKLPYKSIKCLDFQWEEVIFQISETYTHLTAHSQIQSSSPSIPYWHRPTILILVTWFPIFFVLGDVIRLLLLRFFPITKHL